MEGEKALFMASLHPPPFSGAGVENRKPYRKKEERRTYKKKEGEKNGLDFDGGGGV